MAMLAVCPAEVVSILVRRRNARRMTPTEFRQAVRAVRTDVGLYTPVHHLDLTRDIADQAFDLIDRHSINSTDAILLRTALDLAASLRAHQNDLVLVTCDQRLIRAARTEGLDTFNPETQTEAELDALLGP
jgi:predicted nucleic acid-binding protein